jgi:methylase of polypeptide subunit release factors
LPDPGACRYQGMARALLDGAGIARLRTAFLSAEYTRDGIARRFGPDLAASLHRMDASAMLRVTADLGRLSTLIRVFWYGRTERAAEVASAILPLPLGEALTGGLLQTDGEGIRASVQLAPYLNWWLAADFAQRGPFAIDHVTGTGPVSSALANAVSRETVGTALDLGCGGGAQSLHLSAHVGQVTGVDISPRALRLAHTTRLLNELDWEVLEGDLTGPVAGRRFDLVVSHPPYVLGSGAASYLYRDSGRPGDAVCAELTASAPALLEEGGLMQFTASWAHVSGQLWEERVAGWAAGTGCDAWAIQTSRLDPMSYVDLWMRDAGEPADHARRTAWLEWFHQQRIESIGTGLISLRHSASASPSVLCEEIYHQIEQPLGAHVRTWFARQDWLRAHGRHLLSQRYAASGGLRLRQEAELSGPDEWRVLRQVLSAPSGMRWSQTVSPLLASAVSACDGLLPLREQLAKAAVATDADLYTSLAGVEPAVAQLVLRGILVPVD